MTRPSLRKSNVPGRKKGSGKLAESGPIIIKNVQLGVPIYHSCSAAGVDYSTYKEWMRMGVEPSSAYHDFYLKMTKAKSDAVVRNVGIIQKAAIETWQAAAWWLERCYPNEFGRRNPEVAVAIQTNTVVGISNSPEVKNLASELCSLIRKATDAEYKEENE